MTPLVHMNIEKILNMIGRLIERAHCLQQGCNTATINITRFTSLINRK